MCFMFVLNLASSMVLGFVSMSVLLYVVCFLRLGVVCCVVMRVVGGGPLWVVCVFGRVDVVSVVHPVAILSEVFCVICSLLMFVSDASSDHIVETYSSMGLVMGLYVAFPFVSLVLLM